MRDIRVMCSGRVDPTMLLDAFGTRVWGVLVMGCHKGDCHYISGNLQAERKVAMTKRLLGGIGLSPERLRIDWCSSAEADRFRSITESFIDTVAPLGPLGSSEGLSEAELTGRLEAARRTLEDDRVRWLVGKEFDLTEKGNTYGEKVPQERIDDLMGALLAQELLRRKIRMAIETEALSVPEIARAVGVPPREVLRHLVALQQKQQAAITDVEGTAPRYKVVS